jgi:hypothetical protein
VEDFCEGSFRMHILYFVLLFCFTLFILPALLFIENPKKIRILGSCYFFTFSPSCCSLSSLWRTS